MRTRNLHRLLILGVLCLTLIPLGQPARAQEGRQRYFPETGHTLSEPLLSYYESNPYAETTLGYPITVEFADPENNARVQYFQRGRLEYDPALPYASQVRRTPLGLLLYQPGQPVELPLLAPCKTYPEAQPDAKLVCFAFLDYFEAHGGVEQFGAPLTALEIQGGRLTQTFEYARLEWHPEYPSGSQVVLSGLGEQYFLLEETNYALLSPSQEIQPQQSVVQELHASVFLAQALRTGDSIETLYVAVHDQRLGPVAQAQVTVQITYPSGAVQSNLIEPTDQNGVSQASFSVKGGETGVVGVAVTVTYGTFTETAYSSFRVRQDTWPRIKKVASTFQFFQ